jgi:hypothetical protein
VLIIIAGVVPRAAAALFEMLSPAPKTGIRSPNRYSLSAMTAMGQPARGAEKSWKMTATYVEVSLTNPHIRFIILTRDRFIKNIYAIY